MMATLFNSISNLNDFSEEATYRLHGELQVEGNHRVELTTMQAPAGTPIPTPMLLAGWWGDKFNRLFFNSSKMPKLDAVNVSDRPASRAPHRADRIRLDRRQQSRPREPKFRLRFSSGPFTASALSARSTVKIPAGSRARRAPDSLQRCRDAQSFSKYSKLSQSHRGHPANRRAAERRAQ